MTTILNTTFVLSPAVLDPMLAWIRDSYMRSAIKCGADADRSFVARVVSGDDAHTYAVQLAFGSAAEAEKWTSGVGNSLRGIISSRWGEQALCFTTMLEVVDISDGQASAEG